VDHQTNPHPVYKHSAEGPTLLGTIQALDMVDIKLSLSPAQIGKIHEKASRAIKKKQHHRKIRMELRKQIGSVSDTNKQA
jgi:hypothetical protein